MSKNKKLHEHGFSHVVIPVVILVLFVVGFVGLRVMSKSDQANNQTSNRTASDSTGAAKESEPDIALENLGIKDNDSILFTTQATREFASNGLKGFYIFGDSLSGGRINPNFEFASIKSDAEIIAAIDGVIGFIRDQADTKDSEVFLQPKNGSAWTIGYDHLTNVKVKKGDTVKAGDVLGNAAVQNNGLNRFEIQINKDKDGKTTHYCPSTLLAANVKEGILENLTVIQTKWEEVSGLELYDLTKQNPVGCTKTTMTVAEAEGSAQ